MKDALDLIAKRSPARVRAAFYGNSRARALEVKCLDCCAGSGLEVGRCRVFRCALWAFRPGADDRAAPDGVLPALEYLEGLCAGRRGAGGFGRKTPDEPPTGLHGVGE